MGRILKYRLISGSPSEMELSCLEGTSLEVLKDRIKILGNASIR